MPSHLQPTQYYIRLAMQPHCADVLRIRKTLQDALADTFGLTSAGTYMDVLSVDEEGSETVVRTHAAYVPVCLGVGQG